MTAPSLLTWIVIIGFVAFAVMDCIQGKPLLSAAFALTALSLFFPGPVGTHMAIAALGLLLFSIFKNIFRKDPDDTQK